MIVGSNSLVSVAARDMAADGRVRPALSEGSEDALAVQIGRDGDRALASGEFPENTANHTRLFRGDLALAADGLAAGVDLLDHAIAIAEPASGLALLDAPTQAAMGLGGEVLQEQAVHRALEPDMQLGDVALGKRDDAHAGETEVLEQGRHVRLVATDPVQRLGQYDFELAPLGILQKRLHARTEDHAGAGDGSIMIGGDDLPSLPRGMLAADPQLVFDRGDALVVAGIAGV